MAKAPTDIRSLARTYTNSAIKTLVRVMQQPKAPQSARVAAAVALLDRGWGKPAQVMDVNVRKIVREVSDDELANIALGGSEGAAEAPTDPAQLN